MDTTKKKTNRGAIAGAIATVAIVGGIATFAPTQPSDVATSTPPVVEVVGQPTPQVSATNPVTKGPLPKIKIDKKTMFFIKAGTYHKFNQPLAQPAECYHEDGTHYTTMGGRSLAIYDKDLYCTGVVGQ